MQCCFKVTESFTANLYFILLLCNLYEILLANYNIKAIYFILTLSMIKVQVEIKNMKIINCFKCF